MTNPSGSPVRESETEKCLACHGVGFIMGNPYPCRRCNGIGFEYSDAELARAEDLKFPMVEDPSLTGVPVV